MKRRILITGGSHAELPVIKAARNRGDYVITTGMDKYGLGHKEANQYVYGDYSDKEFICQLAREQQVDAIVSGCNDFAYLSTAYACEQLGLPGHDTYETAMCIHHKNRFRNLTREFGIRTPEAISCRNLEEVLHACQRIGFPLMIKPIDLTGGKGVLLCYNRDDVCDAYMRARSFTREPVVIVEEYIQGSHHGASVLLKNEKVIFGFVDNEQYYLNPYLVSGACFPSDVPADVISILFRDIEKIAKQLQLTDGLFHTQFMVNEQSEPIMIDPCRRAPGDLYILLVKYATGVDYPMEILKAECGEELSDQYDMVYHNIARECIMTGQNGKIREIEIDSGLKQNIIDSYIWAGEDTVVEDYFKFKAGILFFQCGSSEELYTEVARFHDLAVIRMK